MQRVFAFIDGAYLRKCALEHLGFEFADPTRLAGIVHSNFGVFDGRLIRTNYYDADPSDAGSASVDTKLDGYWKTVERRNDTALRFGFVRGKGNTKARRQKGVDVLLAVDMVVGAFTGVFDAAILITGDADFIPAVQEVQRRGVIVIVAAWPNSISDDLIGACDRYFNLAEYAHELRTIEIKVGRGT